MSGIVAVSSSLMSGARSVVKDILVDGSSSFGSAGTKPSAGASVKAEKEVEAPVGKAGSTVSGRVCICVGGDRAGGDLTGDPFVISESAEKRETRPPVLAKESLSRENRSGLGGVGFWVEVAIDERLELEAGGDGTGPSSLSCTPREDAESGKDIVGGCGEGELREEG